MPEGDFRALQYQFTAHMRDPEHSPAPTAIEDRRLGIYRRLLYNNVEGIMSNAFPVLRQLLDDQHWHAMVRDYYARHKARTGLFPKMPQEFLHYLNQERDHPLDPPFLRELAHYEWLEAEVLFDPREIDSSNLDAGPELPAGCPVVNPIVRPQAYHFPVHRIAPDYQPDTAPAQPTYLVVFRRRDDEVGFMELNAVSARLLDLMLSNDGRSAHALLMQIADELGHPDPAVIVSGGTDILHTFVDKDIVLGTCPARA